MRGSTQVSQAHWQCLKVKVEVMVVPGLIAEKRG